MSALPLEGAARERAIESFARLPLTVINMLLTQTSGSFINPERLAAVLRARGFADVALNVLYLTGSANFWKDMTTNCFRHITQLPAHIEHQLRRGTTYQEHDASEYDDERASGGPLPPSEPRRAIDQAWRAAFRYILRTLIYARVGIYTGNEHRGMLKWSPSLSIPTNDTLLTCDSYVNKRHTALYSYTVGVDDEDERATFLFQINSAPSGDDDEQGMSDDEIEIGIRDVIDLPSAASLARNVSNDVTIAELIPVHGKGGARVYAGSITTSEPYTRLLSCTYDIRWIMPALRNRFSTSIVPHIRAAVNARLHIDPSEIDDRALYAIDLRQRRPLFRAQSNDPLPIRLRYLDSTQPAQPLIVEHIHTFSTKLSIDDSMRNSLFRVVASHRVYNAAHGGVVAGGLQHRLRLIIDAEWAADGAVTARHTLNEGETYRTAVFLGELVGPPRPHRPIAERAVYAAWYPSADFPRRPAYINVDVLMM